MNTKAQDLFVHALELDPSDREAFLTESCGQDAELRREVEGMLEDAERADALFATEKLDDFSMETRTEEETTGWSKEGDQIGPYTLRQKIGEGGFGVVWMAEQQEPISRMVALKVVKAGMDTKQVLARFEAERQALAMMEHPNIARVLDAGATAGGRPYFAMELVRGLPITEFCDDRKLDTEARLELFQKVCAAVNHAHQKGVIHRDLKPGNVMVTLHGDEPVPKVIDFGIAKATQSRLTDKTLFTRFEQFLGTPVYMSPEQVAISGLDIDTRSDIYSLGVLLYELLAGRPPFDPKTLVSAGYEEMRRIIREQDPLRPSMRVSTVGPEEGSRITTTHGEEPLKIHRLLRGDLDWIVMKSMEKDRSRRYETANGLSADIGRYLKDEPVVASPPSTTYRLRKFARRNRVAMATAAVIAIVLLVASVVSIWLAVRATDAEQRSARLAEEKTDLALKAQSNADLATEHAVRAEQAQRMEAEMRSIAEAEAEQRRREVYASDMFMAGHAVTEENSFILASRLLRKWVPTDGEDDLRDWEWYYLEGLQHQEEFLLNTGGSWLMDVCWSPDGHRILVGGQLGYRTDLGHSSNILLYDVQLKSRLPSPPGAALYRPNAVAWSPDGNYFATGLFGEGVCQVFEADSGTLLHTLRSEGDTSTDALRWTPDSSALIRSTFQTVEIWDPLAGSLTHRYADRGAAMNPGGTHYATHSQGEIVLRPLDPEGETTVLAKAPPHLRERSPTGIGGAWSPDGKTLAWSSIRHSVLLMDAPTGTLIGNLIGHRHRITSLAWNRDSTLLLSTSADGTIRIWDGTTHRLRATLVGHRSIVGAAAWSPDGRRIASVDSVGVIRIWDVRKALEAAREVEEESLRELKCSPREDLFATFGEDGTIRIREFGNPDPIALLEGHTKSIAMIEWRPDGAQLASASWDGTVRTWDAGTWKESSLFQPPDGHAGCLTWSLDGRRLLVGGRKTVWDAVAGEESFRKTNDRFRSPGFIAESADGEKLMWWEGWRYPQVLDRRTGETLRELSSYSFTRVEGCSSRDRSRFGLCSDGSRAWILDGSFDIVATLIGHPISAVAISLSPDGRRAATGGASGDVRVWDVETGLQTLKIQAHQAPVCGIDWSHDGTRIVSGATDGTLRYFDATPGLLRTRSPASLPALSHRIAARERPVEALRMRAAIYEDLGREGEAEADLERAYQLLSMSLRDDDDPGRAASEWLGFLSIPMPQGDEPMKTADTIHPGMVQQVMAEPGRFAGMEINEARRLVRDWLTKEHITTFTRHIGSHPENLDERLLRKVHAQVNGKEDETSKDIVSRIETEWERRREIREESARLRPEDPRVWLSLGTIHEDMREWESAEAAYSRAVQLDPDNLKARERRGVLYADQLHRYADAVPDLSAAIAGKPPAAWILRLRAKCYSWAREWEKCLVDLDAAVRLATAGERPRYRMYRATHYWLPRGEWDRASEDLGQVSSIMKNNGADWWNLRDVALHSLLVGDLEAFAVFLPQLEGVLPENLSDLQARWLLSLQALAPEMVNDKNADELLALAGRVSEPWSSRLAAAIRSRVSPDELGPESGDSWMILISAIASHRRGDEERARRLFAEAEQWVTDQFRAGTNHHVPAAYDWADWAAYLILFREAEALITGKAGALEARMLEILGKTGDSPAS